MDILERCARYHIMMTHELAGHPDFQIGLNMEQLSASLKAVMSQYDDARERNEIAVKSWRQECTQTGKSLPPPVPLFSPYEGEMRGYWLMLHAQDAHEQAAIASALR